LLRNSVNYHALDNAAFIPLISFLQLVILQIEAVNIVVQTFGYRAIIIMDFRYSLSIVLNRPVLYFINTIILSSVTLISFDCSE